MTRPTTLLIAALTFGAAQLATAQAQGPPARHGFWGAFGLGYGNNGLTCSGGCWAARPARAFAWAAR